MGVMSVREFNASVSRAVARVEAGETIEITKHGRVVAELRPRAPVRDAAWHARHAKMMAILDKGLPLGIGRITQDDKYGDAEL